jgi:glycogen(starch) synthase
VRILYWSELYWPYVGGPELLARKLLPALRSRGYEIVVVTSHDHLDLPDRSDLDGIPVHRLPMRSALASADVNALAEVVRRVRILEQDVAPDVVHVSGVGPSAAFHLMGGGASAVPVVVSLRTEVLASQQARNGSVLQRLVRGADWVTGVSREVLEQARRLAPEVSGRSSVLYNFVDPPDRAMPPPPLDPARVVCLGRLVAAKGFDLALRAWPAILARHHAARMVVAGDGPEAASLRRLAGDLGVAHAVDFVGPVAPDAVADLLAASTLVLVPSRREGLSMVAIEAGMLARPVVATRTGGLPEVVVDGWTGRLVPPEDVAALADAVCAVLSRPAVAAELGRRARDRVTTVFARDRCIDAHADIYARLGRPGRPRAARSGAGTDESLHGHARATVP